MKLGIFSGSIQGKSAEELIKYLKELGLRAVELVAKPGKFPGDIQDYLNDDSKIAELKALLAKYDIEISCISCHGNHVHPQKKVRESFCNDFRNAILLAEKLGVDRVATFSGCPGDSSDSIYPNWVTCPWPDDFLKVLNYQWNEVLIPYWKDTARFAMEHNVNKICFEMHPGFCVYNTETLLKLRASVGDIIGANFDPSHLFWQGIDPVASIRRLGPAIYHFHAKDVRVDSYNTSVNGVLDTKHYSDEINRSWIFRTVGYGHGLEVWKDIISNLRMVGYDGALSIEHEDSLMSFDEGLKKAISFLKEVIVSDDKCKIWWA